jgi:arylformamidase
MANNSAQWLDAQYDNRARVPDHPLIFERWRIAAAYSREQASRRLDLRYGEGPNETLDLFPSPQRDAPVLFFIHGGYWRGSDKSEVSFVAPAFVDRGAMVVLPNYDLCPQVTVETIALQMVRALVWTCRHTALYGGDPSRIVVAGHSAGGHLAAMLLSCDWASQGLPTDTVRAAIALSGLFDLDPVSRAPYLQRDLKLSAESVRRLSPVRFPAPRRPLYAMVGAGESEEFLRQTREIGEAWGVPAVPVCEAVPGLNHFTILNALADPSSPVHHLALDVLGLGIPARSARYSPSRM